MTADSVHGLELNREDPESITTLNEAGQRDPDAYPPSSMLELLGSRIFRIGTAFGRGNLLFAVKAGILTSELVYLSSQKA